MPICLLLEELDGRWERKGDEQAIRWAPDFRGRNWPGMHSFEKKDPTGE
jgi:hypothetical protein